MVFADNSPAHWVFSSICDGSEPPTVGEISELLASGQIPIAIALAKTEASKARYRGKLSGMSGGQLIKKWNVCHIDPVKKGDGDKEVNRELADILDEMRRFLSPSNMFVVHNEIGDGKYTYGLGEQHCLIDEFRSARDRKAVGNPKTSFWTTFFENALRAGIKISGQPGPSHWITINSVKPGIKFILVIHRNKMFVEFCIDRGDDFTEDNKRVFDRLFERKAEIEGAFGGELAWDRMDLKRASRIRHVIENGGSENLEKYEEISAEAIGVMIRLRSAFEPYFRDLYWDDGYERIIGELLKYVSEKGRICPMPDPWNALYQLLPNCRQLPSGGWNPPLPLILGGWCADPDTKKMRLEEHILWAADHHSLPKVDAYLRGLPVKSWFHRGE